VRNSDNRDIVRLNLLRTNGVGIYSVMLLSATLSNSTMIAARNSWSVTFPM
jgi:hypothetical protein